MSTELTNTILGSQALLPRAWETFAWELALGTPVTLAADRAGLSPRSGAGSKLARNKKVLARISWLVREDEKIMAEKRRRLEERQWLIRDADIAEFYEVAEEELIISGKPVLDEDGKPVTRLRQRPKLFEDLPAELRACVDAYTLTDSGKANLKLYSKQDAHDKLCKMLGIDGVRREDDKQGEVDDKDPLLTLANQIADLANKLASQDARSA